MLVLTRRIGQSVMIGDNYKVQVTGRRGDVVNLKRTVVGQRASWANLSTGESIDICEGVKLAVIVIKGGQVRLSFNAAEFVPIWREEIYNQMLVETPSGTGYMVNNLVSMDAPTKRRVGMDICFDYPIGADPSKLKYQPIGGREYL